MELTELQNIWSQFDNKINENTRLNKEILKNFIISNTEKKIDWIKIKAIFNLILPVPIIIFIALPRIIFSTEIDFLIGLTMFLSVFVLTYYWAIKYFLILNKIDFSLPITSIKKGLMKLEKFKLKITKIGFLLMPVALIGVFLSADIPFFDKNMIVVYILIISVMISSIYITFKHGVFNRFRKINHEIDKIMELES
jgi:hypothetical protein